MSTAPTQRRLAAVLAADVVGYSRLMAEDETGTLTALRTHRKELFDPQTAKRGGRIVKLMGDGTLVEFTSVVDAVECAIAIQQALSKDDSSIKLRIGINLGDIIIDGDDIYGDGVNIAARLEALAEPGGICISSIVHESLGNRVEVAFADAGEHEVKNIARPIKVFQWPAAGKNQGAPKSAAPKGAGRPSVAVLPLDNMSANPQDEAFVDGMTEDIITAMSLTRWYDVKARNSTFAYKGTSPDVRQAAKELGADYVLEGSVRKSGNRARITVQLIEAVSGNHVWADRFDRQTDDEFGVQDEIAQRIASVMGERIWQDMARGIGGKPLDDYGAYDYAFTAIELLHRLEPSDVARAKLGLQKALELDPQLIVGHLGLGFCHMFEWAYWGDPDGASLERADQHAGKLQDLAPNDAQTFRLLSRVLSAKERYAEAWQKVERALSINPNDGDIIANRGLYHLYQGQFERAIEWFDKVLDYHADTPHTVDIMNYWKAMARFGLRDYAGSVILIERVAGMEYLRNLWLCACQAQLDNQGRAQIHTSAILTANPDFSLTHIGMWKSFQHDADRQHLCEAFRRAGLPQ